MRYQNWDVLLFPESSRIPMQEFDVNFHVVSCQGGNDVKSATTDDEASATIRHTTSQLPLLTGFVPSLDQGTAFRISIHSWEEPKLSSCFSDIVQNTKRVAFEARVYIDGSLLAKRHMMVYTAWPKVIDKIGDSIPSDDCKALRFPKFHDELLDRPHWDAGDLHGRICVVISEGILHYCKDRLLGFDFEQRTDVIAFSFHHAPQYILERAGIAWPHLRAFTCAKQSIPTNEIIEVLENISTPYQSEVHAHVPHYGGSKRNSTVVDGRISQTLMARSSLYRDLVDSGNCLSWGPTNSSLLSETKLFDPLEHQRMSLQRSNSRKWQSLKNENTVYVSATDRSRRSHTGTEMSGVVLARPDFQKAMEEAAVEEILNAMSSEKQDQLLEALKIRSRWSDHANPILPASHLTIPSVMEHGSSSKRKPGKDDDALFDVEGHTNC